MEVNASGSTSTDAIPQAYSNYATLHSNQEQQEQHFFQNNEKLSRLPAEPPAMSSAFQVTDHLSKETTKGQFHCRGSWAPRTCVALMARLMPSSRDSTPVPERKGSRASQERERNGEEDKDEALKKSGRGAWRGWYESWIQWIRNKSEKAFQEGEKGLGLIHCPHIHLFEVMGRI